MIAMHKDGLFKSWLLLLFCTVLTSWAYSQQITITGRVTDKEGLPLEGVTIAVKNSTAGTVSDVDGRFSFKFNKTSSSVLVASYVNYLTQEIAVSNESYFNITLEREATIENTVVVIGYGTQKRKDVTGSVAVVDSLRLQRVPSANFAQAMAGAVPGVSINTNSGGAEGNTVSIMIRGQKSINGNTSALIILDGIPYQGSISDINPNDIASIDVLKDASALAIYGARSANGVIIITTKKGITGKPVISYDGYWGTQAYTNLPEVLEGHDFYNFKVTREPNSITNSERLIDSLGRYTNWLDLATRQGQSMQHVLSVRGGNDNTKYFASLSYYDVKGIAINDNFKRITSRVNLDITIAKWLTYGTNTQLSYNDRAGLAPSFSGDYGVYTFNPLTTPYDSSGNPTIYPWPEDTYFANPLSPTLAGNIDNTYKIYTTNYLLVKLPVKGLSYRFNSGIEYQNREQKTYYGRNTRSGLLSNGNLTTSNSNTTNYTIENILNYDRSFGKHTIGFTGLYSYQEDKVRSDGLYAEGFPNDVLTFYQADQAALIEPNASFAKQTTISQMARINYNYNSRYMLTLTGRRDGYSGFGANYKYGIFPAAAIAWNISNEKFLSTNKALTNLKLRLSYGSNGNTAVSPYQTLAKLSTRNYIDGATTEPGYVPSTFANPDLRWETSTIFNIGLDFGLWGNRINGAIDYYDTRTRDLLLLRTVSDVHGIGEIMQNLGKTGNKGIELGLNTINIQSADFTWSSNANLTINRNKIIDLYGNNLNDTASQWFIGYPINVGFGYVNGGVWQLTDDTLNTPQGKVKPGAAKVRDINGDGVINGSDRTIIGSMQPSFTWGLGNTFSYKNFNLYIFVYGVEGTREVNTLLSDNGVNAGVRYTTVRKNWWTPTNPTNDFYANMLNANPLNAAIYQNSSFVRIRDMSLAYDFSSSILRKIGLAKARVYIQGRNLFTLTKWTGLDPEFSTQTAIPLQKEYIVGLNISL